MPASAASFFTFVLELAEFDIIPTDDVIDWIMITEGGESIFHELGSLFLTLLIGMAMILALILMFYCRDMNQMINVVYYKIRNNIFWNGTLRYIIEGYMDLTFLSLFAIDNGLDWSSSFSRGTSLFSIVTFTVCCASPILMTVYFIRNFNRFRSTNFLNQF
jgi:hypothetical protein